MAIFQTTQPGVRGQIEGGFDFHPSEMLNDDVKLLAVLRIMLADIVAYADWVGVLVDGDDAVGAVESLDEISRKSRES